MKKLLLFISIALFVASCSVDTECRQQIDVRLGVQLTGDSLCLSADSVTYEHTSFTNVRGLSVRGAQRDSLIEDGSKSISALSLPLRKDADTTAFILDYCGLEDSLIFAYTRQQTYVSLACGCAVFCTLDTVYCPTAQLVDSITVLNSAVTTVSEKHIKLYFHKPQ